MPGWASGWVLGAAMLAAAATKVLLALMIPLTSDESLHWMQGRHLAWGFSDHPPGTAAASHLGTMLLGHTLLGLRLVPIAGTLLCSWIAYAMLREIGASRGRAGAAAVAVQLAPMIAFGVFMVPTMPHAPLVFAAQYALLRALRRGRTVDHLLWGSLLGAALLTYYLTAVAGLAGLTFLVLDRRGRRALRNPRLWVGAAVAVAVFAPNVLWNLSRGERSAVHFQIVERNGKEFSPLHVVGFAVLAVVLAGPLLLPAIGRSARALRSGMAAADDWRPFFASFVLVVFGVFGLVACTTKAGAHWAVLAYLNVPLLLFAPHAEPLGRGWMRSAVVATGTLAVACHGIALVGLQRASDALPDLPGLGPVQRDRFLNMDDAARVAHRLAVELAREGYATRLAANRWSVAGPLSFYSPGAACFAVYPPATQHGRDYRDWNPHDETPVELIYVTTTPDVDDAVRAASTSVQCVEAVGRSDEFAWIHRCSGFVPPAGWR